MSPDLDVWLLLLRLVLIPVRGLAYKRLGTL